MNNLELLESKIAESGKKKSFLAKKVGLTPAGFRNCCTNKAEFKASQIQILCEELNIDSLEEKQSIFFAEVGA
ncbi:MAG: toxin-antitoxin system, antitoxin component, Xre family protein [Ruminococcaceae bacterium]|nr:toxin-antitoxin system, antitoxin component, Xre family protein [Oscillospiraceae bacterium]